jgi:hypothetical protein
MKVEIKGNRCIVTREKGDPRFSGSVNAAGESRLLYHIKNILNKQGYDLIKKRMHKDGHLVDDLQQYLRARKRSGDPKKDICIYNGMWNIKGAEEYLNEFGTVILCVTENIFEK